MAWPTFLDDVILSFAEIAPAKTAIVFEKNHLSYNQLALKVNGLASVLLSHGVGARKFVAVLLEPSADITVSMLSIFRCGSVYAPLDSEHPDTQLLERLNEISPAVLITQKRFKERVATWQVPFVFVEDVVDIVANPVANDIRSEDDPACIFFTSGSTGKAKGVVGSYAALAASIVEPSRYLTFSDRDILNSIARYAWSISMLELMAPLVAGGTSLILDKSRALDLPWLSQQAQCCTAFHCPPALLKMLAEYLEANASGLDSLKRIRLVWYGGDTLPFATIQSLQRVFPCAEVGTAYGATEIFGLSHCYFYQRGKADDEVLIGKPVGSTIQCLLSADGQPVDVGVEGELFVGGPRVALSYWQHEALSAEKFPIMDGQRYFATGDYLKLDADGNLEYRQRLDNQVKIRGIRIELGDVEYHLSVMAEIKSAVVIAKDERGSKILSSFFVLHPGASLSVAAIRERLSATLADYMIPKIFTVLDELPYTENFKIDRHALASYEAANEQANCLDDNDITLRLSRLWLEAAKVSPQHQDDHFFNSGGNSLSAILLASLLSRELGNPVEVADIYHNPVFSQQVTLFEPLLINSEAQTHKNIHQKVSPYGALAQLGLFFRELFERRDASITCTRYIICEKGFNDDLLKKSLRLIVERHKTLRTSVKPAEGQLALTLNDVPTEAETLLRRNPGVWAINQSTIDSGKEASENKVQLLDKQSYHFNLRKGPLIAAICSRLNTGEELLQLTVHHIAADDNSMDRLAIDFISIYDALVQHQSPRLEAVSLEYDEFLLDQQQKLESGEYDQKALMICQQLIARLNKSSPLIDIGKSDTAPLFALSKLSRGVAVSLSFTDVVAALSWAFHQQFDRLEFVFCAHVALRKDSAHSPRVGMFVNLLPVMTGVDVEHGAIEHALRVKQDFAKAMAFSDVPYELILKKTESLRRLGRYPFDGFVNELRFEDQYPEGYSDVVIQRAFATGGREISLSFIRGSSGDELKLESPAFTEGTEVLKALLGYMVAYLESLVEARSS